MYNHNQIDSNECYEWEEDSKTFSDLMFQRKNIHAMNNVSNSLKTSECSQTTTAGTNINTEPTQMITREFHRQT